MNPPIETSPDPRVIRSQIDDTRHRMDETIGALGERLRGRHLVDEALHFFRTQNENGNMNKFKQKLSTSANTMVHSVVDTVKANPLPAVLVGAGVAWYLYNQTHRGVANGSSSDPEGYGNYYGESYARDASDLGISAQDIVEPRGGLKEKAGQIQERSKEALHAAGDKIHEMGEQVRERAHELGDRSRQLYRQGRQRVASTIVERPLESGLVILAVGLLAGLALPTPPRLRQTIAPRARQLRRRAEDVVERGRVVIHRAAEAAKTEAEAQGLTFSRGTGAGAGAAAAPRPAGNAAGVGKSPEALPPASAPTTSGQDIWGG
jgi:ElaB/YqjD/DUF883 family membrane-anchored ribosome-binding protein